MAKTDKELTVEIINAMISNQNIKMGSIENITSIIKTVYVTIKGLEG